MVQQEDSRVLYPANDDSPAVIVKTAIKKAVIKKRVMVNKDYILVFLTNKNCGHCKEIIGDGHHSFNRKGDRFDGDLFRKVETVHLHYGGGFDVNSAVLESSTGYRDDDVQHNVRYPKGVKEYVGVWPTLIYVERSHYEAAVRDSTLPLIGTVPGRPIRCCFEGSYRPVKSRFRDRTADLSVEEVLSSKIVPPTKSTLSQ